MPSKVYLTQTDTTIGFISQDIDRLTEIKQRSQHKHYIKAIPSLIKLKELARVPDKYKNRIRRAKKVTFVFPNGFSYRIIHDPRHLKLIQELGWAYTTSANLSNMDYDEVWAKSVADTIIEPLGNHILPSSIIYKLGKKSIKKLR